ncbi:hypothetical protein BV25DRAFT_1825903 [Artomyces pyxidatus]|uniref:Uncharacterized protein n=1 Tax=Artomyces pyxidatus TaxID=48021 RepID=A0ACB8T0Y9_9AGAM|nr:hypothetical protein BV25DRAFT_1825903 [Artomyces pyxidatus]
MAPLGLKEVVLKRNRLQNRQDNVPTIPKPSPTSSFHNNTPKIGGSEGVFIGLVVALTVIFLAACVAIFLLLRFSEPTARDRDRRRQFSIRRRGAPHPLPIGLHVPEASHGGSVTEKLGNMFRGRRAGSGWVQANNDEWDSGDEDTQFNMKLGAAQEGKHATLSEPDHGVAHDGQRASPRYAYDDPFDAPAVHVQGPSTQTPPEYHADASHPSYFPPATRGMSADSVHTFAGGTKFREDI